MQIWSQKRDPSQAIIITDKIVEVLEQVSLPLATGKNVVMHFRDQDLIPDSDAKTFRSVLIYRALSA